MRAHLLQRAISAFVWASICAGCQSDIQDDETALTAAPNGTVEERIERMDKNGDGKLSPSEIGDVKGVPPTTAQADGAQAPSAPLGAVGQAAQGPDAGAAQPASTPETGETDRMK